MADLIQDDFTGENQKLPTGLKVLTVFTIIGCILGYPWRLLGFFNAKQGYEQSKEYLETGMIAGRPAPDFYKMLVTPESLIIQKKALENKLPILILCFVAITLCFYGALEMRKRKKQGYIFWMIGEILPFATSILFLGIGSISGWGALVFLVPVLFIILYTVNRKDLIY